MTPTCSACRFWKQNEGKEHGECRRFPPQVIEKVSTDSDTVYSSTSYEWPLTDDTEWCGEFKAQP